MNKKHDSIKEEQNIIKEISDLSKSFKAMKEELKKEEKKEEQKEEKKIEKEEQEEEEEEDLVITNRSFLNHIIIR